MLFNDKYNHCGDDELIALFLKSGNNEFVGILYNRYGHLVLGLCIKYLKNRTEAQEAVIGIFTKLITDLKKHKVEFFKSWLYVYSKNYCLMELRKRQSMLKKELDLQDNRLLVMETTDPAHLKEKEAQYEIMEKALGELNAEQKNCIHLFYFERKSYREIAESTGYSTSDVKSFIQNGKRNLKLKMEQLTNER